MIKAPTAYTSTSVLPDLTPLLDIIFIVLVFLLLTAAVKLQTLDVTLPTSDSSALTHVEQPALTVSILHSEPHWAINGTRYLSWDEFRRELLSASKRQDKPLVIGADQQAHIQHLVQLLTLLQENGIAATQLLTEQP